jgi:sec-independent protein translocase protein TatA
MLRGLEGWHFIVLALVFVVLFGAKKLPDSARSVAKSLNIFKTELKDGEVKKEKPDSGTKPAE